MKLYDELAEWWPLLSPVADYAEEAAFFLGLMAEITTRQAATLLELGSGGGNNAWHMKAAFAAVTLVDLEPPMIAISQQLNPDCAHHVGDMRTFRAEKPYDVVFIHDAIDYMTTFDDLRQALQTAYVHCKPGGMAVLVPDAVRETFEPATDHGGADGPADRAVRYLEWSYDPDPTDTHYITQYIVVRRAGQQVTVTQETHQIGLFARADWLRLLAEVGFVAEVMPDPFERAVFIGRKMP